MPFRPWKTIEEMNEGLIANHNSVISPEDICIHLGDLVMGSKKNNVPQIIPRLNGKHILIPGNHCWLPHEIKKPEKLRWYEDLYLANGISQIAYGTVKLSMLTNDNKHDKILMSHFPPKSIDDHYEGREDQYKKLQHDLQDDEYFLCGHCHSRQHLLQDRVYHVGCDAEIHEYKPVNLDVVLNRLGLV